MRSASWDGRVGLVPVGPMGAVGLLGSVRLARIVGSVGLVGLARAIWLSVLADAVGLVGLALLGPMRSVVRVGWVGMAPVGLMGVIGLSDRAVSVGLERLLPIRLSGLVVWLSKMGFPIGSVWLDELVVGSARWLAWLVTPMMGDARLVEVGGLAGPSGAIA